MNSLIGNYNISANYNSFVRRHDILLENLKFMFSRYITLTDFLKKNVGNYKSDSN